MSELKTAVQWADALLEWSNVIPPITDPMGKNWKQPERELILIDDTHALMNQKTFNELAEYTYTNPTGIYPGKMWKAKQGNPWIWMLRWFGNHSDPKFVTCCDRKILIV